jgi:hypothetical protein
MYLLESDTSVSLSGAWLLSASLDEKECPVPTLGYIGYSTMENARRLLGRLNIRPNLRRWIPR